MRSLRCRRNRCRTVRIHAHSTPHGGVALLARETYLSSTGVRPLTFAVLRCLSDGEFHSGESLARRLDVSRASVWNALNDAEVRGLRVQRVHGRGYRLAHALDWLDAARIRAAIADAGLRVEVLDCCSSTNAELLRAAGQGAPGGSVLVAELQTAGRGRLGRAWHSGLASALTFSLLWRCERPVAGLAGLSLAVGVAIVRTLRRHGIEAQLKWPNDLLWRERKLGGILIEIRGDALGPCAVVIGVGLNVRLSADERRRIDQPVADLAESGGASVTRSDLLVDMLLELSVTLGEFATQGFAAMRDAWMRYHAHQGVEVTMLQPDGAHVAGVACGVDESGRLLLDTEAGRKTFLSGDVSLRVAHAGRH